MSQFRNRVIAFKNAVDYFKSSVEDLAAYPASTEPARQRMKNINQCLYEMKRERELAQREPLPPTLAHVDRDRWEYDIKAKFREIEDGCAKVLTEALEYQTVLEQKGMESGESGTHPGQAHPTSQRWQLYQDMTKEIPRLCGEITEMENRLSALCGQIDEIAPDVKPVASLTPVILAGENWVEKNKRMPHDFIPNAIRTRADAVQAEVKEHQSRAHEVAERNERCSEAVRTFCRATEALWQAEFSQPFDPNPFLKSIHAALLQACKALNEANRLAAWERVDHDGVYHQFRDFNHRILSQPSYDWACELLAKANDGQLPEELLTQTWESESLRDAIRWLRILIVGLSGEGAVLPAKMEEQDPICETVGKRFSEVAKTLFTVRKGTATEANVGARIPQDLTIVPVSENKITHGSAIVSNKQRGGQVAHTIVNVGPVTKGDSLPREDQIVFRVYDFSASYMGQDSSGGQCRTKRANAKWIQYWFKIEIFNTRNINVGLMDIFVVFAKDKNDLHRVIPGLHTGRIKAGAPHCPDVTSMNLPSNEWTREVFRGTLWGAKMAAVQDCDEIFLTAKTVDGFTYRRPLGIAIEET